MSLFQMSISGAIIILAVIIIRALAINRLPKKTFIALWGIVLLRLLVPFSLPSPFSAYSLVDDHISIAQGTTAFEKTNIFPVGLPASGEEIQGLTSLNISPYVIVWTIGMIVCALFFTISYCISCKEFQESLPIENDFLMKWIAEHKLTRPIQIRQFSRISTPLTYGIFKPIILMPKNIKWEDTRQIEYILAHEFVHVRRFDAAIKLLLAATLCIHWFNPLVWAMYILSNRDIELSCDESVVRSFGDNSKSAYARALIHMEEKKSTLTHLYNNFSKYAIEERITAIMKMKKTTIGVTISAIIVVLGITTIFATSALASEDNTLKIQPEKQNAASIGNKQVEDLVTYDLVEVRHYTDGAAPYVFWSRTNNTEKTITNIQFSMLAFDKNGKPLNLPWTVMDSSAGYSYDVLCEWQPVNLGPHSTADSNDGSEEGGWSLGWSIPNDDKELQKLFSQVAYVLCFDKQITFEDGKVWNNPNYDKWLEAYSGKQTSIKVLTNYYANLKSIAWTN